MPAKWLPLPSPTPSLRDTRHPRPLELDDKLWVKKKQNCKAYFFLTSWFSCHCLLFQISFFLFRSRNTVHFCWVPNTPWNMFLKGILCGNLLLPIMVQNSTHNDIAQTLRNDISRSLHNDISRTLHITISLELYMARTCSFAATASCISKLQHSCW